MAKLAMTCVCVGCGTEVKDKEGKPVEKLYDQVENQWKTILTSSFCIQTLLVNTNILKLLECHKCGQVCDRYLEVILSSSTDPSYTPMPLSPEIKSAAIQVCGTLVLLDLALQSQPAFRHVLINCGHAGTVLRQRLFFIILQHMAESYKICVGCYCVKAKPTISTFLDWAWSQPSWMATADGFPQILGASSLSRYTCC